MSRGRHDRAWCVFALVALASSARVEAQDHVHPAPVADAGAAQAPVDHSQHHQAGMAMLFSGLDSSGTAWLPVETPMFAAHLSSGPWQVMVHGRAFGQFLYESGEEHRTAHQAGGINWAMGMARRPLGRGTLGVRGMWSAEPWSIRGCGYPALLATGESCDGDSIHDKQHPHDAFMELAAEYFRPIGHDLRWHVYGGPVGEPALGPAAFPHRLSSFGNPIAPISHHWLDATHITFGVITTGVSGATWRVEGSVFNGREPDEQRADIDVGRWDSFSGRLSVNPTRRLSLQVSAGRLTGAEREGTRAVDVTRATASVSYHGLFGARAWATTLAWGVNVEGGRTSHAGLLESMAELASGSRVFMRGELVGKSAHDLHVHEVAPETLYTVGKLQFGYLKDVLAGRGLVGAVGGSVSAALVPAALAPRYGGRVAPGVGVLMAVWASPH